MLQVIEFTEKKTVTSSKVYISASQLVVLYTCLVNKRKALEDYESYRSFATTFMTLNMRLESWMKALYKLRYAFL